MNILVIGAGALGSLVGGVLSRKHDVTIIGRQEQVDVLNRDGLHIRGLTVGDFHPNATTGYPADMSFDLIIICVKSYNTEMALDHVAPYIKETTFFLSLQNGLNNEELISKKLKDDNLPGSVLGGITCHGVTYKGPGLVKHAGKGDTYIGLYTGPHDKITKEKVERIVQAFNDAGLEVELTEAIRREIWAKTIINSAINPLTAITGSRNGDLLTDRYLREMMDHLVEEGVEIARSHDIDLTVEEIIKRTHAVAERTKKNISSMLQDITRKRRTEIECINGALYEKAKLTNIYAPLNRSMYHLINAIQRQYMKED